MTSFIRKVFLAVCLSVIATSIVMLLLGAWNIGVSGDEYIDILSFRGWGWAADPSTVHFGVYGMSAQLINHLIAFSLGAEPLGAVVFSSEAFAARHLGSALLGVLSAFAAGGMAYSVTKNREIGVWVTSSVFIIQPFLGHSFMNAKDIPVAAGYTLTTYGLVLVINQLSRPKGSLISYIFIVVLITVGIWLAVGTRYLFFAPIFLTVAVLVVSLAALVAFRRLTLWPVCRSYLLLAFGLVLALILLFASNPCVVSRPNFCDSSLQVFQRSLSDSVEVQFTAPTLLAGRLVSPVDPPFWTLPAVLLAGLPIFITALAFFGAVFGPENLNSNRSLRTISAQRLQVLTGLMIAILGLQCCLVPLATILTRQEIYDMQRHHLYVYPAAASLAGVGLALLLNRTYFPARADVIFRNTVALIAAGVLWFSLADGLRLWPYNYVYVNPVASIQGYGNMWETDYWGTSLRESLRYVPKDETFEVVGFFWIVRPFMAQRGDKAVGMEAGPDEIFVIQTNRPGLGWSGLPDQCKIVKRITRSLRGKEIPISEVGICPRSLETGAASFEDIVNHDP